MGIECDRINNIANVIRMVEILSLGLSLPVTHYGIKASGLLVHISS